MPPKRAAKAPKGTTQPTRRSGRIASREASKEPSAELPAPAPASTSTSAAAEPASAAPPPPKTAVKSTIVKQKSTEEIIRVITIMRRNGDTVSALKFINSLTSEQHEAALLGFAQQTADLEDRVVELEGDLEYSKNETKWWKDNSKPNLRRDGFLRKMDEVEKKISAAQTEENTTTSPVAAPTAPVAPSAGPVAAAQSPPQQGGQESPALAVLASPPTVAAEIVPARPAAPSPWQKIMAGLAGYVPGLRKRAAEDEAATAAPARKRTRVDEPEKTPVRLRPTHQKHLMRSVKNPAVPSSLSTITERSEQSLLDMVPDTTPSRKRRFDDSAIQPHSSMPESTPSVPGSTPHPKRRTLQSVRAKRALASNPPAPVPYAWEKQPGMQKPKEPNADARAAKVEHYMQMKRELERLKQDADIKEIEAHSVHRRKRVKIDELAVIPHNRPGDPSGTFRMPEPDSDDEISVDEDFEETMNVYSATEKAQDESIEPIQPIQPIQPIKPIQPIQPIQPVQPVQPEEPVFTFPEVGQRPETYEETEEFKDAAGDLFAAGLAEFVTV